MSVLQHAVIRVVSLTQLIYNLLYVCRMQREQVTAMQGSCCRHIQGMGAGTAARQPHQPSLLSQHKPATIVHAGHTTTCGKAAAASWSGSSRVPCTPSSLVIICQGSSNFNGTEQQQPTHGPHSSSGGARPHRHAFQLLQLSPRDHDTIVLDKPHKQLSGTGNTQFQAKQRFSMIV